MTSALAPTDQLVITACFVCFTEKNETKLTYKMLVPIFLLLSEVDAPMSEDSSPRHEPLKSPPSRAGLYLPGFLGPPPPLPSNFGEAYVPSAPNGTKSANLMTSMDQIIRPPSPVETNVSIEPQGGGMMTLSLFLQCLSPVFAGNVRTTCFLDFHRCSKLCCSRTSFAYAFLFRILLHSLFLPRMFNVHNLHHYNCKTLLFFDSFMELLLNFHACSIGPYSIHTP